MLASLFSCLNSKQYRWVFTCQDKLCFSLNLEHQITLATSPRYRLLRAAYYSLSKTCDGVKSQTCELSDSRLRGRKVPSMPTLTTSEGSIVPYLHHDSWWLSSQLLNVGQASLSTALCNTIDGAKSQNFETASLVMSHSTSHSCGIKSCPSCLGRGRN
jgi:hypothetical protein